MARINTCGARAQSGHYVVGLLWRPLGAREDQGGICCWSCPLWPLALPHCYPSVNLPRDSPCASPGPHPRLHLLCEHSFLQCHTGKGGGCPPDARRTGMLPPFVSSARQPREVLSLGCRPCCRPAAGLLTAWGSCVGHRAWAGLGWQPSPGIAWPAWARWGGPSLGAEWGYVATP